MYILHTWLQVSIAGGIHIRQTRPAGGKAGDEGASGPAIGGISVAPTVLQAMGSQRPSKRARSMAALVSEEALAAARTAELL